MGENKFAHCLIASYQWQVFFCFGVVVFLLFMCSGLCVRVLYCPICRLLLKCQFPEKKPAGPESRYAGYKLICNVEDTSVDFCQDNVSSRHGIFRMHTPVHACGASIFVSWTKRRAHHPATKDREKRVTARIWNRTSNLLVLCHPARHLAGQVLW